ncbi:hypothetical protein BACI9J_880002 [Bacillus altitudinis]|nr:hypothetical protein BACI9J_880002 [Bacillus altitudinis]
MSALEAGGQRLVRLGQGLRSLREERGEAFEPLDRLAHATVELVVGLAERDGRLVGDVAIRDELLDLSLQC